MTSMAPSKVRDWPPRPPLATPLLKRLAAAALVTRTRNREDECRPLVALTTPDRDLHDRMAHVFGCIASTAGQSLTEIDTLTRLRRHLSQTMRHLDRDTDGATLA